MSDGGSPPGEAADRTRGDLSRQLGAWSGGVAARVVADLGRTNGRRGGWTGGAARRGVTSDSRVRSPRGAVGAVCEPRLRSRGCGVASSERRETKTPREEKAGF